jgi:hypothetical protein
MGMRFLFGALAAYGLVYLFRRAWLPAPLLNRYGVIGLAFAAAFVGKAVARAVARRASGVSSTSSSPPQDDTRRWLQAIVGPLIG